MGSVGLGWVERCKEAIRLAAAAARQPFKTACLKLPVPRLHQSNAPSLPAAYLLSPHPPPPLATSAGDRRLVIKFRPAKKAAVHLRALGLVDDEGAPTTAEENLQCQQAVDRDGNSADPSPRIWLGNIAPTTTSKSLHAVLGRCADGQGAAVAVAAVACCSGVATAAASCPGQHINRCS